MNHIDINLLKMKHSHIRDSNILFDEPTHVYTILTDPYNKVYFCDNMES